MLELGDGEDVPGDQNREKLRPPHDQYVGHGERARHDNACDKTQGWVGAELRNVDQQAERRERAEYRCHKDGVGRTGERAPELPESCGAAATLHGGEYNRVFRRTRRAAVVAVGRPMSATVTLHRWDEIALEKVTEMVSRKLVTGEREMLAQIYLKRGCLVPMHSHESEQMTYILQGALKFLIGGEEITVREGEVLHIPSWVEHQAEALEDTFELDLFSPIRQDWLDHTDDYFHR